jgi:CRP/FNR family transcriptional regulator
MLSPSTVHDERSASAEAWFVRRCPMAPLPPGLLPDLMHALGIDAGAPTAEAALAIPLWRVRSGTTLVHEGAPSEFVHVVRSGSFKCLKTSEDGYEQVLAFAAPGEVLGFEALCRGHHPVSAVALEDATVYALPVRELDGWRQRFPALDHALQLALSRQLARAGEIAEMMAAVAAEVRLARFLVWLSNSMAERGQSPRHRQPARRGARDRQPLVHGAGRMGLRARGQPRSRDPRPAGPAHLYPQHARSGRRGTAQCRHCRPPSCRAAAQCGELSRACSRRWRWLPGAAGQHGADPQSSVTP